MREAMIADRRETGFVIPLRVHKALTADVEKRMLVWMAERTPSAVNSDHLDWVRVCIATASRSKLRAGVARPACASAGEFFPGAQLGGRQPGWHAGTSPAPAATAVWLLCRPHGRHVWRAGADGEIGVLGLRPLADRGRHTRVFLHTLNPELPHDLHHGTLPSFAEHFRSHRNPHAADIGKHGAPCEPLRRQTEEKQL
jgi:hypothetical protein